MEYIHFRSVDYKVTKLNRQSNAQYIKYISVGDIVHYEMKMGRTTRPGQGNAALVVEVYANQILQGEATQNEVLSMFEQRKNRRAALELEELI